MSVMQQPQPYQQCSDNSADRKLGEYWERQFCELAARYGLMFTPQQWHKTQSATAMHKLNGKWNVLTLPDITIWTAPGQHHEVKHKAPTKGGSYGLEVYRFNALVSFARETQQDVYYTIHNHALTTGRDCPTSCPEHWFTVNVLDLIDKHRTFPGITWINGQRKEADIHYWHATLWQPLTQVWETTIAVPF